MTQDVNVVLLNFPNTKTHEMVTENEDGSYTIALNTRDTAERRAESYRHALRKHIERNDFEKDNVQDIESDAHQ